MKEHGATTAMDEKLVDLVITGDIVLPDQIVKKGTLAINRGKVTSIQSDGTSPAAKKVIDAGGCLVMPGFIDAHVHTFSIPGQCFTESTSAAAAGGVTTIIDHPFDHPTGIATVDNLKKKIELIGKEALVDIALLGTVKKENLDVIEPLVEAGICGFKLSLYETDAVRFPRMPDNYLLEAFAKIAKAGLHAGVHAENDEIVQYLVKRYREEGKTYPRAHGESRPPVAEVEATLRALELAYTTGVHLHVHHVSLSRCFDFIQMYREEGVNVTAETCPHYLLFSEDDMDWLKGFGKINPPLRAKIEPEILWHYLNEGYIDIVTSDDAAWPRDKKNKPSIFDNASGVPGVQTVAPLIYSEGVRKGRISIHYLVELLSEGPAKIFKLWPRKGSLMPGSDGDIAIIDPREEWEIKDEDMLQPAKWSPYTGMKLAGKVVTTLVRGQVVYSRGKIAGRPGYGRFVAAK
jgi:allantoinase